MLENIQQRWQEASTPIRAGLVAGVLVIAAVFAGLAYWTMRDTYQVLFSDLEPQDAQVMITELEKMKIPYRLEEGGRVILVDKEAVYKTRLVLMGKGVNLRGVVGLEIFNNTDFGTTEFAQKINYQRALQGELARTIMEFEEIKFARVHLVMPESGLFRKNNVKPKASISLVMKGDSQLSPEQVAGIQRLVAASVPEIDPASVTILDQRGIALTRRADAERDGEISGGRLEAKKAVETYLTRKIADMLDKLVGSGQAIVSVDASLNLDQVKVTREDVIPLSNKSGESAGAVVRRRETHPVVRDGTSAAIGVGKSEGGEQSQRNTAQSMQAATVELEYQNGRKVEQVVSTPGSIKRISVGVLLPNTIPSDQLEKIREVVAMAAGITPERGDSIALYSVDQLAGKVGKEGIQPAVVGVEQSERSRLPQATSGAESSHVIHIIAFILVAILAIAGGMTLLRKRHASRVEQSTVRIMNEMERQEALADIRRWLYSDSTSVRSGVSQ